MIKTALWTKLMVSEQHSGFGYKLLQILQRLPVPLLLILDLEGGLTVIRPLFIINSKI